MKDGQAELDNDVEGSEADGIDSDIETVRTKEAKGKKVTRTAGIKSTKTDPKIATLPSRPTSKIRQPAAKSPAICLSI